ncbi:MAG: hypothetical protein KBI01_09520 [Oscillospiraceae bacterium]|nr:hypothetical protein [Oscillospiraceae bacterium]
MADLLGIIKTAREQGIAAFNKAARLTNEDKGNLMITYCLKNLKCRKINDWGRDLDTDQYLGLGQNGWIIYTHDIENGAGEIEIINSNVKRLTDKDILDYILSDECTNKEFLQFMKKTADSYDGLYF